MEVKDKRCTCWSRAQQTFSINIVNVLGFVGNTWSVITTQIFGFSVKVAKGVHKQICVAMFP